MAEIAEIIKKYAVENALSYGAAQPKNVLGKVLAEEPELRKDAANTLKEVNAVVKDITEMIQLQQKNLSKQQEQ